MRVCVCALVSVADSGWRRTSLQRARLLSEFNKTELMSFATRIGAACRARDRKTAIVAAIIVEFDAREAQQHKGSV